MLLAERGALSWKDTVKALSAPFTGLAMVKDVEDRNATVVAVEVGMGVAGMSATAAIPAAIVRVTRSAL